MYATLHDYNTGELIRYATREEAEASREQARHDGGAGVIMLDDEGAIVPEGAPDADTARRVYVID
jgi:hypothetical protein